MTEQEKFWKGEFGKLYTDRNTISPEEFEQLHVTSYGVTRTEMNEKAFGGLKKDIKILEVGCNTGMQLLQLQREGYTNLWGIELQEYAAEQAKKNTQGMNIIRSSGFDIPYKDNYFDLVFTNGVLIHISPDDLNAFMSEIHRVSGEYIAGLEYYSEKLEALPYRNNDGFMWRGNYPQIYIDSFACTLENISKYKYQDSENVDIMYLLRKH